MAQRLKALWIALMLAVLPAMSPAATYSAIELDHAKTHELLIIASRLSKYPMPRKEPRVMVLETKDFNEAAGGIPALGFFQPSRPEYIVLDGGMDADIGDTVLVHELVHYLQWLNGVMPAEEIGCARRIWLEQEAFVVSYRFELERGGVQHGMVRVDTKCDIKL